MTKIKDIVGRLISEKIQGNNKRYKKDINNSSPIIGNIISSIDDASASVVSEIKNPHIKLNLRDCKQYVSKDPVARSCTDIKGLYTASQIAEYTHPNPRIAAFINENLNRLPKSISEIVGQLSSAMAFGFSCAFPSFQMIKGELWIVNLDVLSHENVVFLGKDGFLTSVKYQDITTKIVPYSQIIHVTNGYATNFDSPYGNPELLAALPYIKTKGSLISDMILAGKVAATGIVVAQTPDTNVTVYDEKGQASKNIPSTTYLANQLKNLHSNTYIVTDEATRLTSLNLNSGLGSFYSQAIKICDEYIRRSFGVPAMILDQPDSPWAASARLSERQLNILTATVIPIINQIKREFKKKIIKPLILHNFSYQNHNNNFGEFNESHTVDKDAQEKKLGQLYQAIQAGVLSADDKEVQKIIREIIGIEQKNAKQMLEEQIKDTEAKTYLTNLSNQAMAVGQMEIDKLNAINQKEIESLVSPQENTPKINPKPSTSDHTPTITEE
jgi:hypothetical protein